MIPAKHLRAATVFANLGVLACLTAVGIEAFRAHPAPGLPERFDPVALALPNTASASRDMAVVWQQLDRPRPAPVLVEAEKPSAEALGWRLLMAGLDPERPELSSSIVETPGGQQFVLSVGGAAVQGLTLERVEVLDVEGARETVATLRGPDLQPRILRMRRK